MPTCRSTKRTPPRGALRKEVRPNSVRLAASDVPFGRDAVLREQSEQHHFAERQSITLTAMELRSAHHEKATIKA